MVPLEGDGLLVTECGMASMRVVPAFDEIEDGQAGLVDDGKPSTEYRFYIGSIGTDAGRFARAVRGHWGIENDLHWSLDVAFREDESRLRDPQARENFAVLRHMALSRLKNDKREKMGIKNKRLKAGWDEKYLSNLLFQNGKRHDGALACPCREY